MGFMETKFCTTCDEDYDWAAPACPGCVRRRYDEAQEKKLAALVKERDEARAEIEELRQTIAQLRFAASLTHSED